jgi:hypothetical protein
MTYEEAKKVEFENYKTARKKVGSDIHPFMSPYYDSIESSRYFISKKIERLIDEVIENKLKAITNSEMSFNHGAGIVLPSTQNQYEKSKKKPKDGE